MKGNAVPRFQVGLPPCGTTVRFLGPAAGTLSCAVSASLSRRSRGATRRSELLAYCSDVHHMGAERAVHADPERQVRLHSSRCGDVAEIEQLLTCPSEPLAEQTRNLFLRR